MTIHALDATTRTIGTVRRHVTLTNTSDRWLLVGDHHAVLAHYATEAEAIRACGRQHWDDSGCLSIGVLPPGATTEGDMDVPLEVPLSEAELAERRATRLAAGDEVYRAFFGKVPSL